MDIRVGDCPLGAKCEEVKTENGKPYIARCPWYTQVSGHDPNTGAEKSEWACAIAWLPSLLINTANESRKNVAATESFRNQMAQPQTQHVHLISNTGPINKPATLEEVPPILLR